ncbi:MAG TPA: DUF192 domain-containing protein [Ilumatobacteraceae bacterium]|nr:DUF192 domain-containing protein [Ilumatobacteraceae bacterium]
MSALRQWPLRRSVAVGSILAVGLLGCSDTTTFDDSTQVAVTSGPVSVGDGEGDGESDGDGQVDIAPGGQQPEGFSTVTVRITDTDGQICEVCVWLADTPEERAQGLMGVTDLGDAAGMVFRFEEPSAGVFYMFQTPTPLSIAWFDPDHVGSTDMAPCLDTTGACPLYSPGVEYNLALEVFKGGLDELGVGPGSRLELIDGTEAEECPLAVNP